MTSQNCKIIIHCPRCAARELSWPTMNNFICAQCGFVLYLNIAAAVAVIIECNNRLLFGLRKHDPGKGMLDLPGGFVEQGESAEEAALREVREETGIELQQIEYLFSLPNRYLYQDIAYDTLDLIYCSCLAEPPRMQAADDLEQLLWVDRDMVEYDRIAFSSLRTAVARYLESGRAKSLESAEESR